MYTKLYVTPHDGSLHTWMRSCNATCDMKKNNSLRLYNVKFINKEQFTSNVRPLLKITQR